MQIEIQTHPIFFMFAFNIYFVFIDLILKNFEILIDEIMNADVGF